MDVSVVVPIRCDAACDGHDRLVRHLDALLLEGADAIVADGSDHATFDRHRGVFAHLRHIAVAPRDGTNGKVAGVHAGVSAARHERVVLADDDVLYDADTVLALIRRLDGADLVLPQNVFEGPLRWHTVWDTGRSLLNRAFGHDYPGTMAIRRSAFVRAGGYRDDVLFENLELIRTIRAAGGRVRWADDLFVPRSPPAVGTFLHQRIRQAYDDLAQPLRLVVEASILPISVVLAVRRSGKLAWLGIGVMAAAEVGRRRSRGAGVFPVIASVAAPLWVVERAICVWIAIGAKVLRGGVRYRGGRLRTAASTRRQLERRFRSATDRPHASRRTAASSSSGRIGTTGRSFDEPPAPSRPRRPAEPDRERAAVHPDRPRSS